MELNSRLQLKELTLTLIKTFNNKETENNWSSTDVIIQNISKIVKSSSHSSISSPSLNDSVAKTVSILEQTVININTD